MALMKKIVPAFLLVVVVAALVLWRVLGGGNPQLDGQVTNYCAERRTRRGEGHSVEP